MRIYRLPASFSGQKEFELSPKESRYLVSVLRFQEGRTFTGRDSDGQPWLLTLQKKGDAYSLSCEMATESEAGENASDALPLFEGPLPLIHLYPCLLKGKKLESVIRQACEMGVHHITPVASTYCIASVVADEKRSAHKTQRFEAQVREALQQSGSRITTQVHPTITLQELIKTWDTSSTGIFFHQAQENSPSLGEVLAHYRTQQETDAPLALLIGPEGGFSADECEALLRCGFHGVLLKTNILRAETASLYAIAAVQSLILETNT